MDDSNRIILDFLKVVKLTEELISKDEKVLTLWLNSENELLFGNSPFGIIISGEGQKLIDWLEIQAGKKEGTTF